MNLSLKVLNYLKSKNETISFAESITGGLLSGSFVKNSTASCALKEAYVVYNSDIKAKLLNVKEKTIEKYSVVSKEVALEMVNGLAEKTKANLLVAITGNAGPNYEKDTNKLVSYLALKYYENIKVYKIEYTQNKRDKILNELVDTVYSKICEFLNIQE